MESSYPPLLTKKLCNIIRIAFFSVQKSVSKTKLFILDFDKRGKILKKTMNNLVLDHQPSLGCRSDNMDLSFLSPMSCRSHDVHLSFESPREYEFSCSSSVSSYKPFNPRRRRRGTRQRHLRNHRTSYHQYQYPYHPATPLVWAEDVVSEKSSAAGFGWSPLVSRQVRITDSPFADGGGDESVKVDMEAEKFIERFYRELRLQKWMAAIEN
ncbi:uncharacterized protein LOC126677461 [Mercurialis annua]|uniref:uncharacterized protein LOC126677461 n=1 Tax=Mercurialis annua TaxID=3986 RepID=UPI002160096C|nr:uncharacterized protein LOC126677461 [Mercurialis annua]